MAERILTIDQTHPLLLLGSNDANLRRMEAAFPDTEFLARGNQILLRGRRRALDEIERAVDELTAIAVQQGDLTASDVDAVLALTTTDPDTSATLSGQVVAYSPSGGLVRTKTPGQARLLEVAQRNDIVFAVGPAGTGKTFMAVAIAVAALKARQVKRIVLCRPAVEAGERLGFLPGDFRNKIDPYLRPLYDALEALLPTEKLRAHMEQQVIEIVPLAFMRGRTLNSAFVILDEAQNATSIQMKMFLTRLGINSRAIVTGDVTQIDLDSRTASGLIEGREILEGLPGIGLVDFDHRDVVRHPLVRAIINAYEQHSSEQRS